MEERTILRRQWAEEARSGSGKNVKDVTVRKRSEGGEAEEEEVV